jgi:hypothetical protein
MSKDILAVSVIALVISAVVLLAKVVILAMEHLAIVALILAIAKLANLAAHAVISEAGPHGQKSQVALLQHLAAQMEQYKSNAKSCNL